MINWTDVQQLQTLFDQLNTQNPSSVKAPFSYPGYEITSRDVEARALVGYITLLRQKGDLSGLLDHLEYALASNSLSDVARRIARAEIRTLETDLLARFTTAINDLQDEETAAGKGSLPDTATVPALLTEVKEEEWVDVHLAYRLAQVRIVRSGNIPVEFEAATFLNTLSQTLQLWQDRLSLGLNAHFHWRYVGTNGQISIYLIVTIHAPESAMGHTAANGFSRMLIHHLPLAEVYQFEPVTDEGHLSELIQPVPVRSAAILQKREEILTLRDRQLYCALPLNGNNYAFYDLMQYLAQPGGMKIVDIAIQPTCLTAQEITDIHDMLAYDDLAQQDDVGLIRLSAHSRDGMRYQQLVEMYQNLISHLETEAYEVQVRVAESDQADITPLAMMAGRTLFGVSGFDTTPSAYDVTGNATLHLMELNPRSIAPSHLKRLRQLFTLSEAAVVSRLPRTHNSGIPGVPRLSLRYTDLPSDLSSEGCILGQAVERRFTANPVKLAYPDRTRHVYVVGRTGTGKTTLLQNMALQDIEHGHGVAIIDPHGDLIESMLARIPPERAGDVILFDPGDVERPVGINLLDVEGIVAKNMAVADFIGLMYSMYDPHHTGIVGPRFEQAVRSAMQTTMYLKGTTLIDVLRVIADNKFAKALRGHANDVVLENYWKTIFEQQTDFHKSEVLDYITSKFSRFVTDPVVRHIIGQSRTTLNFTDVVNNRKILLVNLAKGKIGAFNSHFLGFILVSRMLISFFERTQQAVSDRVPFYLYIDEFQNFATTGLESMLSEGRKYGLGLVLANQYMVQLSESMREAVTSNVGTICAFQVGQRDAEFIAREMYPAFSVDDMVNMPAYHMAIKLLNNGQSLLPFTLKTYPEHRPSRQDLAHAIRQHSRYRYGRSASLVSDEIREQFECSPEERVRLSGSHS